MNRFHKWSKDDTIISYFYAKFEVKGLPIKDDVELAEQVIGTTLSSLKMQVSNINFILGYDTNVLSDFSKIQQDVVDEYSNLSYDELLSVVTEIINKRDFEDNIRKLEEKKKVRKLEEKKKLSQKELDDIFRKMGKDPSKMRKVVTN